MALRTQVAPYVLVGLRADLPDPAEVAQGYLFHSTDTKECLVLVINPVTQVRTWEDFCVPAATGPGSTVGPALLKWAGGTAALTIGQLFFIADDPTATNGLVGGPVLLTAYPIGSQRTAQNLRINLRTATGGTVIVGLNRDGVPVLTATFAAPGIQTVVGTANIPAGSSLDLVFTTDSPLGVTDVLISATVELV